MENNSKVGVTINNNQIPWALFTRNNASGGGGPITDTATIVSWATSYYNNQNSDISINYSGANPAIVIGPTLLLVEVSFTTTVLGSVAPTVLGSVAPTVAPTDVIFYLGDSLGNPILETRTYEMLSHITTVNYYDCNYLAQGEYFMWMKYDSLGIVTGLSIDHPILTIKRIG